MMAEQRIGRAVHPAQRRAPAPTHPDGSLRFDEPAPRGAGPAAQQQPTEPAAPPAPPAGPPQSVEEAQKRFLARYLPWLVAQVLGGEDIDVPETVEEWVALARALHHAQQHPAAYAPAQMRRLAQALEQAQKPARPAGE